MGINNDTNIANGFHFQREKVLGPLTPSISLSLAHVSRLGPDRELRGRGFRAVTPPTSALTH